jgi:hypothetical protein
VLAASSDQPSEDQKEKRKGNTKEPQSKLKPERRAPGSQSRILPWHWRSARTESCRAKIIFFLGGLSHLELIMLHGLENSFVPFLPHVPPVV